MDERERRIYEICERQDRFKPQAFFFIYEAIARSHLETGKTGHVTAKELLEGFAKEARSRFGPMALEVLEHMGFRSTRDVGELVYLMIEEGLLAKTEEDHVEDFEGVFDFREEFVEKYEW